MLSIIASLQENDLDGGVDELELEPTHAEESVDSVDYSSVKNEIMSHNILSNHA